MSDLRAQTVEIRFAKSPGVIIRAVPLICIVIA